MDVRAFDNHRNNRAASRPAAAAILKEHTATWTRERIFKDYVFLIYYYERAIAVNRMTPDDFDNDFFN